MVRFLLIVVLLLSTVAAPAQLNRQQLFKLKPAVVVTPQAGTIFGNTIPVGAGPYDDGTELSLGVKVIPTVNGTISAIRWYKPAGMTTTLTVTLFRFDNGTNSFTNLGGGTRSGDGTTGWVEVPLSAPVSVTAGSYYLAQVHTNGVYYASTSYFTADYYSTGGYIYAPMTQATATTLSGYNGVFHYSFNASEPSTESYNAGNYWVDVKFTPN